MAKNQSYEHGNKLSVVVTNPTSPLSGMPCRYGLRTGVAVTNKGDGGNAADHTSVNFGPAAWQLAVTDTSGGINPGDRLFYIDGAGAAPGSLSDVATGGYFFGFAMEAVPAGTTAIILVSHVENTGAVGA